MENAEKSLGAIKEPVIVRLKKRLKIASAFTTALGALATIAFVFMFLALSDIANLEPDLTLEWYITGICMMVWAAFLVSAFITISFLYTYLDETPN